MSIFDEIADKHHPGMDPFAMEYTEEDFSRTPPPDHMSEEAKAWDFCYNSKDTDVFKLEISDGGARFLCRDCGKVPAFVGDDGQEVISMAAEPLVKLRPHQCSCNPMKQWGCDCWPGFELEIQPGSHYPADILDHLKALYGEEKTLEFLRSIGGRAAGDLAKQVRMEANTMGVGPSAEGIRGCVYQFVADAEKAGPFPKVMPDLRSGC